VRQVYESLHSKGFEILGVSLDRESSLDKLADFTRDNKMPWLQICDGKAWEAELAQKFGVHAIPNALLVDGNTGIIASQGNSLRGEALGPAVEAALAHLTGTGSGAPAPLPAPAETPGSKAAGNPPQPQPDPNPLVAKAEALVKEGKLLGDTVFLAQRKAPVPGPIDLPPPSTMNLRGRDVAKVARAGYLRVGWYYHCNKCGRWHVHTAGGYLIAPDTVATAYHVTSPLDSMKEGFPIAVDNEDRIVPITGVLASDQAMDAIVLRVEKGHGQPLPLSDSVEVGDTVYCFSDPLKQRNYFSDGIVNRIHTLGNRGEGKVEGADPATVRINVSTDWAPGSSGAAVLDAAGNVIGHVATMAPLFEKTPSANSATDETHGTDRFHGASLITLHDAIPAKSLLSLLKKAGKGVAQE
jgi:hypothetical protein